MADDAADDDLVLALRLADIADAITMARFRAHDLVVDTKPDLTPVTEADRSVERALREELATARPADAVLGEEYGDDGDAPRRWIIDPIDGTKNFVRGVPVWATLVALAEAGDVTVGVASAPALGSRWWAMAGQGAFATDLASPQPRRLEVSRVSDLADASLAYSDSAGWPGAALPALISATWRQRGYGDFWSHLLVAEGAVDVAAEPDLQSYDMAALVPIVREAGGRITGFDGTAAPWSGSAVTTNGLLHDEVLSLLQL